MHERMDKDPTDCNFLIDGFPRNEDNLSGWNKQMEGKHKLQFVLFFDCADEVIIQYFFTVEVCLFQQIFLHKYIINSSNNNHLLQICLQKLLTSNVHHGIILFDF